jgi:hypothetical protein
MVDRIVAGRVSGKIAISCHQKRWHLHNWQKLFANRFRLVHQGPQNRFFEVR